VIGCFFGYRDGVRSGPQERDSRLLAAQILRTTPSQTDATLATMVYPNAEHARAYAGSLRQRGLNVFADPMPDPDALPPGGAVMAGLDGLNLQPSRADRPVMVTAGESVYLAGWAFDPSTRMPFEHGFARLREGVLLPLAYGMNRPALKRSLGLQRAHVGFKAYFAADLLGAGENRIQLTFVGFDRSATTDVVAVLVKR
jgi:hypothetical protein